MKTVLRYLTIIGIICICQDIKGQVSVNVNSNQALALHATAGNDTLICLGHSAILGGAPTATGGTPGYIYLWAPSTGLTSTTVSNPVCSATGSTSYTLTVTDLIGCTFTSTVNIAVDPCAGVGQIVQGFSALIFPNPNNGLFTLQLNSNNSEQMVNLIITNLLGQTVVKDKLNFESGNLLKHFDLSNFSNGNYLLTLYGDHTFVNIKFVKN